MSTTFADFWIPARKTRSTGDKLTTSESGGNQEAAVINFRKIPTLSRPSLEHQEIFFQITALLQMPGTGMVEADSYPTWFEEVVECEKADQLPASETFSSSRPPAQPLSPGHGQEPAGCWDGDSLSQRKTPSHGSKGSILEETKLPRYILLRCVSATKKTHRKSLVSILHLYKREYEIIILRARGI